MLDHTSTAKQIAEDRGCSMATVNNKANKIGIRLKGRTPEQHEALMAALATVKPRKRTVKKGKPAPAPKKTRKTRKVIAPVEATDQFSDAVDDYFNQGKKLISDIRGRLAELDKERDMLTEKLNTLLLLHPDHRDK